MRFADGDDVRRKREALQDVVRAWVSMKDLE
jgi:hypothetical protein